MTLERRAELARTLRALLRQPGPLAGPDRLLALAIGSALGFPAPRGPGAGPRAAPAGAASKGASGSARGLHGAEGKHGEGV